MIKWGPLFAVAMSVFVAVPVMGENSTGHEISRFYGVWTAEANCKSANEQSEGYYFNLDNNYYEHGFGTRCSEVSMWLDGRVFV